MKTITLLFCILALNIAAQTNSIFKSNERDLLAMNVTFKSSKFNNTVNLTDNKIDLKLYKYKDPAEDKSTGVGLLISGIAFTTAAILESGDFKIYKGETARQIMLGVGIGLTITGFGITISN